MPFNFMDEIKRCERAISIGKITKDEIIEGLKVRLGFIEIKLSKIQTEKEEVIAALKELEKQ